MIRALILLHLVLFSQSIFSNKYCAIDRHTFYCLDQVTGISQQFEIHPIEVEGQRRKLISGGVIMTNPSQLLALSSEGQLNSFMNPFEQLDCHPQETEEIQEVAYTPNEFNVTLAPTDGTLERINQLLDVMHEAGVCSLDVIQDPHLEINNIDDVLEQFVCITNHESNFGRDNIGMGGRGPWGIHPDHDQSGGPCTSLSPINRSSNGHEVKESSAYHNKTLQMDNFKCALILYSSPDSNNNGFRSWGQRLSNAPWGSNRHCLTSDRDDFDFKRLLGTKMCCTEQCKQEIDASI